MINKKYSGNYTSNTCPSLSAKEDGEEGAGGGSNGVSKGKVKLDGGGKGEGNGKGKEEDVCMRDICVIDSTVDGSPAGERYE